MSQNTILLPHEFDGNQINFLQPRVNKLGGQSVLINYTNDEGNSGPFFMQTCKVRIPFGIDQSSPKNGEPVKYHFSASLANDETTNEQLKLFTQNVRAVDDLAKSNSCQNTTWFGKKLSTELCNEFYKSAEKFPKDSKWPSTLKIKLPFRNGRPDFTLYDENKSPINILDEDGNINQEAIPKGAEAICLIQSTGVWFVGKTQFGVGYKLVQAKIFKSNKISGYSIIEDEEEEEEGEEETEIKDDVE